MITGKNAFCPRLNDPSVPCEEKLLLINHTCFTHHTDYHHSYGFHASLLLGKNSDLNASKTIDAKTRAVMYFIRLSCVAYQHLPLDSRIVCDTNVPAIKVGRVRDGVYPGSISDATFLSYST